MDNKEMTDAIFEAEAQLQTAPQAAEQEFMAGDTKHQLGMLWNTLPPNAKKYVKSNNPDQYRQASNFFQPK